MTASTEPLGFQLIEIMGHQRSAGWVEPRVFGGAVLLHATMPAGEPEERVLDEGIWIDNEYCGPGSRIRETRLAVDQHVGLPSGFRTPGAPRSGWRGIPTAGAASRSAGKRSRSPGTATPPGSSNAPPLPTSWA